MSQICIVLSILDEIDFSLTVSQLRDSENRKSVTIRSIIHLRCFLLWKQNLTFVVLASSLSWCGDHRWQKIFSVWWNFLWFITTLQRVRQWISSYLERWRRDEAYQPIYIGQCVKSTIYFRTSAAKLRVTDEIIYTPIWHRLWKFV